MGVSAETTLNRRDFGVNWGSNIPGTSIPSVSDTVRISLQIDAGKKKSTPDEDAAVAIVLQQLEEEGILDAYFGSDTKKKEKQLIDRLRKEIDDYLAGDVSFGEFHWV